ncbi:MAG: hypothetical protein U9Q83_01330 [Bacteroidota bacterium]|nr:hypothetical protein [Bacteroidota bacterium]
MKTQLLKISDNIFDRLYDSFESTKGFRIISSLLIFVFLISLLIAQINVWFKFPPEYAAILPTDYFDAIELTFRLLLGIEVLGMVFVLAHSVSKSVAKQFEILSLILLRQAFKEFSKYDIFHNWADALQPISYMLSDAIGALIIFIGIFYYLKIQKHQTISCSIEQSKRYKSVKKLLALSMIVVFISIAVYDLFHFISTGEQIEFFLLFYTILVFTDILLVIISLRYNHSYAVVFRNSALAVATVFIRLALSAPRYFDAALGIIAVGFVILTGLFYNKYRNQFP